MILENIYTKKTKICTYNDVKNLYEHFFKYCFVISNITIYFNRI